MLCHRPDTLVHELQAQGKLWEMTSAWTEEMERIHAAMRELVCRRYRFTNIDTAYSMLHNRPKPLCCLLLESVSCLITNPVVGPHDASWCILVST